MPAPKGDDQPHSPSLDTPVQYGDCEQTQEAPSSPEPPTWYDRIQERIGDGDFKGPYAQLYERHGGDLRAVALSGSQDRTPAPPPQASPASDTLERVSQQTSAIASSVNVIDHQFKLQLLGRVGALEKEVSLIKEQCERTRDACKGIEQKLSLRKGVPCDIIERLDSMSGFTYAFCKGMEDAGIFRMSKK